MLYPFPGHVKLENDRESALSFNSKLSQNGKCVDKESRTLVVSFPEMSSIARRSETAVADKNAIHLFL